MMISFQTLQLSFSRLTIVRSSWIYVLLFAPLFAASQSADPQLLWLNRWLDYPNNYQIECKEAIHLNSKDLDFAPTFYNGKMVFISSRKGTILKDRQIGESFFDIYQSTIDSAGKGTVPNEFSTSLNSLYHEGPMSFTSAGDRVYFTRNNLEAGQKSKGKEKDRLKIMEAVKGPNDWIQIQESVLCNPTYSVCHPAISADGKIIVFASDMPGGKGGMDLYFAKWENEQWSAPINLGPSINTQGNEWFPVLTADNTLFFASNGLAGLGGLDLFTANFAGGYWKKVTNLGAPFNSNQDDLGFALNLDGKSGFFSSNRPGGTGKDDLYHFEISQIPLPAQITAALIAVDANSKIRLPGVSIYIIDKAFLKSGKEEISIKSDSTGRLDLVVQRKESLDIDKPNAITDINGNAETVFLSGHTYQLFASALGYQARSITIDTISRYIQLQMDKEPCLKGFGYITSRGNKKPIDGAEVRMVSSCFKDTLISYADQMGQFKYCLDRGCTYDLVIRKDGYVSGAGKLDPSKPELLRNLNYTLMKPIATETISTGSIIVLENIYYDFDKAAIRKDASFELDQLAEIMEKHPSMEIELIAHTDSRGEILYNQKLSLDRALSAKKYLETKGIAAKRIRAFGYGESKLRNRCIEGVDCSEEEHQYNRRTEVQVLKVDGQVEVKYQQ